MLNKLFSKLKKNIIFTSPYFLAIYSVLFLFSINQREYKLDVLWIPLIISLIFTSIIFLIAKFIFKKIEIAALISSLIVFLSLSYGRFLEIGEDNAKKITKLKTEPEVFIGIIVLIILASLIFLIFKYKHRLIPVNKYVTLISLVLVIFSLYNVASFEYKAGRLFTEENKSQDTKTYEYVNPNPSDPDIYYFIFDRYGGEKSLNEQYGFDNSNFLNFLKEKGFYIANNSTANYPKTFLSLGASLNMEYMDFMTKETNGGKSSDQSKMTPYIRNNKVLDFLKKRGYKYVHMGSWWTPTKQNSAADIIFTPNTSPYMNADEFTTGFFNTTIAAPILKVILKNPLDVSQDPQNNIHRKSAAYQFEKIDEISKIPGPKFVFVHILLPHDPFVFDKDCNPITEDQKKENTDQINYINQLQCVNKNIEEMTQTILNNSQNPPVIIYQADEGPFPMNEPISDDQSWALANNVSLQEKFPILNAYYFPGKSTENLYDTITPVNSFRALLNTYFNQNLPLLPDKNYVFQDDNNYYKFTEITEKL